MKCYDENNYNKLLDLLKIDKNENKNITISLRNSIFKEQSELFLKILDLFSIEDKDLDHIDIQICPDKSPIIISYKYDNSGIYIITTPI